MGSRLAGVGRAVGDIGLGLWAWLSRPGKADQGVIWFLPWWGRFWLVEQCLEGCSHVSGFRVGLRPAGGAISGVQFLFSSGFWLLVRRFLFWRWDWTLVYNSSKYWDLSDFPYFPKILSLRSFDNSYTPCLLVIVTVHFTFDERKIL